MFRFILVSSFILLLFQTSRAQVRKDSVYFHEIIERAIDSNNGLPVIVKNTNVLFHRKYKSKSRLFRFLRDKYGDGIFNEEEQLVVQSDIAITNCFFDGSLEFVDYKFNNSLNIFNSDLHEIVFEGDFQTINIQGNSTYNIRLLQSDFQGKVDVIENSADYIKIQQSAFHRALSLVSNNISSEIIVSNNVFSSGMGFECENINDSLTYTRNFYHNLQFDVKGTNSETVLLEENEFQSDNKYQRIHFRGVVGALIMENNSIGSTVDLTGLSVENRLIMADNEIGSYIAFNDLIFPEFFNLLRWNQFQGYKITVFEKVRSSNREFWSSLIECNSDLMVMPDKEEKMVIPYHGENTLELEDANAFEKLIYSYKSLYSIYTTRGDLESANACYAEMKEIQRRRLKYIYQKEGGFANYFRWQLLVLLKIYTNHGTDPALSMVISVYVILIFAVFYFFFPSEWDVTSKSKLISDFKDFIQKNEKGYFIPFLTVLVGFLVSMINAFTLSLNSFVTLGFGNIPAKGFARYVCVLEGFIGWFLLSIFTVALINQVLA